VSLKTRLADVEKSIPRASDAADRAMLREMSDEELRDILRAGLVAPDQQPTCAIGHALADMSGEATAALLRGRQRQEGSGEHDS
jgi:hypothetical protein